MPSSRKISSSAFLLTLALLFDGATSKQETLCTFGSSKQDAATNCIFQIQPSDQDSFVRWVVVPEAAKLLGPDLPKVDATGLPDGSYVYANFSQNDGRDNEAEISSRKITPADGVTAIRFSYFMYGTKLATLELKKLCRQNYETLWRRNGITSQRPEWIREQIPITDSTVLIDCSLVFFVSLYQRASSFHGVVALDDISTSSELLDVEPIDAGFCSFEYSAKNWQSTKLWPSQTRPKAKTVDWELVLARSSLDSIKSDHTFDAPLGHVMRMVAMDADSSGCFSATLVSQRKIKDPADYPKQCLQMSAKWLIRAMQPENRTSTAEIFVQLVDDTTSLAVATLWSGSLAVQAAEWITMQAHLDLSAFAQQSRSLFDNAPRYRLAVEGVICSSQAALLAGIALDDLRYDTKDCRINGDDDFEQASPMRLWLSKPDSEEPRNNWLPVPANHSFSYLAPPIDHTFGRNRSGWLLVSEDNNEAVTKLYIDMNHVTQAFCLNLWFWTRKTNDITRRSLIIKNLINKTETYEIAIPNDYNEQWLPATVPFTTTSYLVDTIVIEAHGGFAIDDIVYSDPPCTTRSLKQAPPSDALTRSFNTMPRTESSADICDFENSAKCTHWTVATSSLIEKKDHFEIVNSTYGYKYLNGPKYDGTFSDLPAVGKYALLMPRPSGTPPEPTSITAFIYSDDLNLTTYGCFSFKYYMFGPATGSLNVYVMDGTVDMLRLWTRQGSQLDLWMTAEINLAILNSTLKDSFTLIIEAERYASYYYGAIAIDDVTLQKTCKDTTNDITVEYICSFEGKDRPDCLPIKSDPTSNSWEVVQVNELTQQNVNLEHDASHGTELGHVLFSSAKNETPNFKPISLKNAEIYGCMSLSYQRGSPCVQFWLTVEDSKGEYKERRQLLVPAGDVADFGTWKRLHVDLPQMVTSKPSQIAGSTYRRLTMEASYNEGGGVFGCDIAASFNWIALDDLTFSLNSCKRPISCNFDSYCRNFEINTLPTTNSMPGLHGNGWRQGSHIQGPTAPISSNFANYGVVDMFNGRGKADLPDTAVFATKWLYGSLGSRPIVITFFYFFAPSGSYPGSGELSLYIETLEKTSLIWDVSQGDATWQFARASTTQPAGQYRFSLRGKRRGTLNDKEESKFALAIDDINVFEAVNGAALPPNADAENRYYRCTFDQDNDVNFCNIDWAISQQPRNSKVTWTVAKSENAPNADFPRRDSLGSTGSYAYVVFNKAGTGSNFANIETVPVRENDRMTAIQFHYFMFGTSLATLRLIKKCKGAEYSLWQRKGITALVPEWHFQQVLTGDVTGCTIAFQAIIDDEKRNYHGVVALDTIIMASTWREVDTDRGNVCTFEYETCSKKWTSPSRPSQPEQPSSLTWERIRAGGETFIGEDHSLISPEGYVMHMRAPRSDGNKVKSACYSAVLQSIFAIDDIVKRPIQCLQMSARLLLGLAKEDQVPATGQLSIHLVDTTTSQKRATLWSGSLKVQSALDDETWTTLNARLDLTPWAQQVINAAVTTSPKFYVAIEGLACTTSSVSYLGIAIDDLVYNPLVCRITGDENFEVVPAVPVWNLAPGVATTGYNWLPIQSDHLYSYLSPQVDHTFNGKNRGGLIVSEDDTAAVTQLTIDTHNLASSFCVNFWAWTKKDGTLSQKQITIRNTGPNKQVFNVKFRPEAYKETWELVTIPFMATSSSVDRIILEAHGGFAFDDITFNNYPCELRVTSVMLTTTDVSFAPDYDTRKTVREESIDRCTFEEKCAHWTIATSPSIDKKDHFEVVDAKTGFDNLNGPKWDATFIDMPAVGKYLLLITRPNVELEPTAMTAFMSSDELNSTIYGCLSFKYYIYGPATGALNVYAMSDTVDMLPLWTRQGSQYDSWQTVHINLAKLRKASEDTFTLVFEAQRYASYYYGAIAVDDVELRSACPANAVNNQPKPLSYSCDFEGLDGDYCTLNNSIQGDKDFQIVQVKSLALGAGLKTDDSLGTTLGHVIMSRDVTNKSQSVLLNNPETTGCLSFSYQRSSPCIKLEIALSTSLTGIIYRRQLLLPVGDSADFGQWRQLHVDLPKFFLRMPQNDGIADIRLIRIEASFDTEAELFGCDSQKENWIALDSFRFKNAYCLRQLSCTNFGSGSYCGRFEKGTLPSNSYMPWLSANGNNPLSHVIGPGSTSNNNISPVEYAIVDLYNARGKKDLPDTALFTTDWLLSYGRPIAVTFFYFFSPSSSSNESGELSVFIEYYNDETLGFSKKTLLWQMNQGDATWQFARVGVLQPVSGQYRIRFQGKRRASLTSRQEFVLAIDDINIVEEFIASSLPKGADIPQPPVITTTAAPVPVTTTMVPPVVSTTTQQAKITTTILVPIVTTTLLAPSVASTTTLTTQRYTTGSTLAPTTSFVFIDTTTSPVRTTLPTAQSTVTITEPTTTPVRPSDVTTVTTLPTTQTTAFITTTQSTVTVTESTVTTTAKVVTETIQPSTVTLTPFVTTTGSGTNITIIEVNIVLVGEMIVDQVLISQQPVTWQNLSQSSDNNDLNKKVVAIIEQQLKTIYDRAKLRYSELSIANLKEVKVTIPRFWPQNSKRSVIVRTGEQIGADWSVRMSEKVGNDTNLGEYKAGASTKLGNAITELSREGAFDAAFGQGTNVKVSVTDAKLVPIESKENDNEGLGDGAIAGIAIGCLLGFGLICLAIFFGFRHYKSKHQIQKAAPATTSYYDNARYDDEIEDNNKQRQQEDEQQPRGYYQDDELQQYQDDGEKEGQEQQQNENEDETRYVPQSYYDDEPAADDGNNDKDPNVNPVYKATESKPERKESAGSSSSSSSSSQSSSSSSDEEEAKDGKERKIDSDGIEMSKFRVQSPQKPHNNSEAAF